MLGTGRALCWFWVDELLALVPEEMLVQACQSAGHLESLSASASLSVFCN